MILEKQLCFWQETETKWEAIKWMITEADWGNLESNISVE